MKPADFLIIVFLCLAVSSARAQSPSQRNPDVSNKGLFTKSTPGINADAFKSQSVSAASAALHKLADDYYAWRNENYPVRSSEAGLHTWDDRLTDYSPGKIAERAQHVRSLLEKVRAMKTDNWPKDERIDWILFRAQLENVEFGDRIFKFEFTNPQVYTGECTNAIFTMLKKEYDTPRKRALAATARLKQMPALLKQGLSNLRNPVKLYAQLAIQSARSMDPLLNSSLMALDVDLSPNEHEELVKARDAALAALHSYADELEKRVPKMVDFTPMGEANYNYYLKHVLLLPLNASEVEMIGRAELARYRALEALLPDPKLADPDPKRAAHIPPNQESFLKAYESRETEMINFLKEHNLVTLPDYLGPFQIRQLPEAFKPTSPGGFMNPPGVYDKDSTGFFFIPTYNPDSKNFYIRAAIEDPRPILGHEGIPGHFLQLSIANHVNDEIRRQHEDSVFVEGWALYGEEMLMRTGLYPNNSPAQGQILRLSRYRAARIGVVCRRGEEEDGLGFGIGGRGSGIGIGVMRRRTRPQRVARADHDHVVHSRVAVGRKHHPDDRVRPGLDRDKTAPDRQADAVRQPLDGGCGRRAGGQHAPRQNGQNRPITEQNLHAGRPPWRRFALNCISV